LAKIVNLCTTASDEIETKNCDLQREDFSCRQGSGRSGAMFRTVVIVLGSFVLSGCASWSNWNRNVAECPCDDCLPPAVAGKYWYFGHLDNLLVKCTAHRCASRDLKQFTCDGEKMNRDFRDGYTQAYIDLAVGRPACVPAVPPKKYWYAWHRSCAGRDAVEQWYAGYRDGLDNGMNSGVSRFNEIVPNLDCNCVSAAYINPYHSAQMTAPSGVVPANGQTLTQLSDENVDEEDQELAQEPNSQYEQAPPSPEMTPENVYVPASYYPPEAYRSPEMPPVAPRAY